MLSIDSALAQLVAWARDSDNVLALVQTGSTVRGDGRQDQFSDLDIEVITARPRELLNDDGWFTALGDVWVTLRFDDMEIPTRLVVYDGGLKVDYSIASSDRL